MREFPKFIETKKGLAISETFYSIQGEGKFIGVPSVFLRTQGCVLNCEWCDTYNVWKNGNIYSYEELLNLWKERNIYQMLLKPNVHLILTGGEPLIRQTELSGFLNYVKDLDSNFNPTIEIETSGTVKPRKSLLSNFNLYFNVSPKLKSSGMEMDRRNRFDVMTYFSLLSNTKKAVFKFVVANKEDVEEAFKTYIDPYNLNIKSVYLMAESQTREQLQKREIEVVELAKEYGLNYSTRLHLHIWDKATGV